MVQRKYRPDLRKPRATPAREASQALNDARTKRLTKSRRREIASDAAQARWHPGPRGGRLIRWVLRPTEKYLHHDKGMAISRHTTIREAMEARKRLYEAYPSRCPRGSIKVEKIR